MSTSLVTRRLRIEGAVQGVGYRDSMCREARRHAVAGWVRNRPDGSVEALVQGGREAVESIIAWARRGPPAARVLRVDIEPVPDGETRTYQGFEWVRTG